MEADDDRFRQMFYEEARELLIGLEEGLMDLERRQSDRAHLDRTFRAAHSLKGAAAMVGLRALAEFTHGIEAVLDRIRSGALTVDSNIITTLLEARDHLAAMVEAEAAGSPIPASSDLNERLTMLLQGPTAGPKPAPPAPVAPPAPAPVAKAKEPKPEPEPEPAPPEVTPPPEPPPPTKSKARSRKAAQPPTEGKTTPKPRAAKAKKPAPVPALAPAPAPAPAPGGLTAFRITFQPGPDTLRRGSHPLGVLDELRELGEASITTDPETVPALDELDPIRCYLTWHIDLVTSADLDRLDDVFLFVAGDSMVRLERREADGRYVAVELPSSAHREAPAAVVEAPALAASPAPFPVETPPSPPPVRTPPPEPAPALAAAAEPKPKAAPRPGAPPAAPGGSGPVRPPARIRVDAGQLDDLVGLAGELAVLSDNLQHLRDVPGVHPWVHTLEALERVSRQVRDTTLELRMVPVDELFTRFPRVVRDLADRTGKEVELRIIGQDTRLDRTIVERLGDPMIHLIRNAVDHAIETPAERVEAGKPRMGRITLSAGHEGDRVTIRVSDDGRGLDRQRIYRKGLTLGLLPVGMSIDDPRVDTLIFEPGFSTRDTTTELSGRGVGLDVVRDSVRALRGSLSIDTKPGKGTTFIFRLPLTLALIDGLLVEAAGSRYVVPLAQVEECVALNGTRPALSRGRPCVAVRGDLVPMVPLRKLFQAQGDPPPRQELLLTSHSGQRVGVAVDKLLGRVQAVIQSLGEGLRGLNRFSGATILGDGSVSLILDLAALVTESRAADNHTTPTGGTRAEGF